MQKSERTPKKQLTHSSDATAKRKNKRWLLLRLTCWLTMLYQSRQQVRNITSTTVNNKSK